MLQALHLSVTIFGSCSYGYRKIIVESYHATVFFLIISHLPPGHPIISSEFKMAAVSVKRSIPLDLTYLRMPRRQKVMVRYLGSTGSAALFLLDGKILT